MGTTAASPTDDRAGTEDVSILVTLRRSATDPVGDVGAWSSLSGLDFVETFSDNDAFNACLLRDGAFGNEKRQQYKQKMRHSPVPPFFEKFAEDWPSDATIADKSGSRRSSVTSVTNAGVRYYRAAIITVSSNDLVGRIHDRMPAILRPQDYERWLGSDPDPHDLLITFPSEPMRMWPISKRVNKPENDDPAILEAIELA